MKKKVTKKAVKKTIKKITKESHQPSKAYRDAAMAITSKASDPLERYVITIAIKDFCAALFSLARVDVSLGKDLLSEVSKEYSLLIKDAK